MSDANKDLQQALEQFWSYMARRQGGTVLVEELKLNFWDDDHDTMERRRYRSDLHRATISEIEKQNGGWGDVSGIDLLLEAITADYLHEDVLYECLETLKPARRTILLERGLLSPLYHTRYLAAEHVAHYIIPHRTELMEFLICHDDHKLVSRYALNTLSDLHPAKAVEYALPRLTDEDAYMRLASVLALQAAGHSLPAELVATLRTDSNEYVREAATELVVAKQ
ncbi:hypothetical protein SAMN00120144_2356 [Hymenobacter roseosalivarius DSM 11622]|uniref:HEAT repeat domain-containing protein n=1 Tax=Hymenobacter roseosalivarius DSM 11622 TaxID=645990 RepID=A0A1W1VLM1_9BACT|nr:HEAT repeat domain-containing protein [Hymenobacter roseosalivarius]SMB94216.1 hypothetical protein SAMN00120144_2356 [Hymenobacter roseosalivarius DSM 11622]